MVIGLAEMEARFNAAIGVLASELDNLRAPLQNVVQDLTKERAGMEM